jgi:hypothetical protein
MDLWGLCPDCDRWFYLPETNAERAVEWACPVCDREPVSLENRAPVALMKKVSP